MKLGIVGGGVVGTALARSYMEFAEVQVYDVVKERATHSVGAVLESDLIFICLPTPQKKDSLECDTSYLDEFFERVGKTCPEENYVIRSTVPIGYTRRLRERYTLPNLVHSPEFLTARCSITDAQIPSRNIIGSASGVLSRNSETSLDSNPVILHNLYAKRFRGVPVYHMTSDESEAVKLFLNSFFAVKVAYFNECHRLADKLGLNWESVMDGLLSDGRIAHSHTQVPGQDGKFGFGGNCLPKDLANMMDCLEKAEVSNLVTHAAHTRNKHDRRKGQTE